MVYNENNGLKHGVAYNYDLVLVGLLSLVNGLFGLPSLGTSTVPCLIHLNALSKTSSSSSSSSSKTRTDTRKADERFQDDATRRAGQPRRDSVAPRFISVQETRLTGLCAHLLLGGSLFFLPALHFLPMPVLYGVSLWMGLSVLPGLQLWNRFLLLFQESELYMNDPDMIAGNSMMFLQYMRLRKVHIYTAMQLDLVQRNEKNEI